MIITQTPLRISFAGGGTDLEAYYKSREGFVVNAGIDKSVFVIVNGRYDDKIYVNYSRKEIVDSIDKLEHELVREAMRITGVRNGVEITMLSDIPSQGSGLGSSSSITVGLLNALHVHQREQVGPEQLAQEACEIEIDRCRKPIGKQDQYIAAYGGVSAFRFRCDGRVEREKIDMSDGETRELASSLFMFYTDQTRKADEILTEQRQNTTANFDFLDGIKSMAIEARSNLLRNNFDALGDILDRNWRTKRRLASNISNDVIEEMHKLAMRSGATGAKICGAGGGGFLLVYCPPSNHRKLMTGMQAYRLMPIQLEPDGSKVIFNYRRPSWK